MSEEIFRLDPYAKTCVARVTKVCSDGVLLDKTVFYPQGGGQPGDTGFIKSTSGGVGRVTNTVRNRESGDHVHLIENAQKFCVGDSVSAEIDWLRRYCFMRMHSALHILCSIVKGGVTGGQIGTEKSRLDFDLGEEKMDRNYIQDTMNFIIKNDHPLVAKWVSEEELEQKPELIRTMSVKPPSGAGHVRLIDIKGVDIQPCGGTHVARSGEIGAIRVGKIENKGKRNRRINIHLLD